ncbi:MAG: DUF4430 domain-containing protein [Lachnospiraceae bacterium]|nr:DUF4430 domain-containing protein [Lachnospiraceae bacterium]
MKTKCMKKTTSFILCMVLTVAMALSTTGCNGSQNNDTPSASSAGTSVTSDAAVLGEGNTSFAFSVTDQDGNLTQFEIHTDKATVGDALLELNLIAGDDSEYGLYVKTVNNITVDYDKDGKYWAFYIDGEYAATGVDATQITDGASYAFKVE